MRRGLGSPTRFLAFDEREQISAHIVLVRRAQTMRGALIDLQNCAFDELGLEQASVGERHDLVVVALNDQGRHVELLQVLGLVSFGERLDAEVCGTDGAGNSRTFWRLRKHPAHIQSRLQIDGSGGKISRLFDRAVEGMNGDSPEILFALLRRQFTVQSNGVS